MSWENQGWNRLKAVHNRHAKQSKSGKNWRFHKKKAAHLSGFSG